MVTFNFDNFQAKFLNGFQEQQQHIDCMDLAIKNDGVKWCRKKYFEIPRAPSELLLPSAKKICPERLNWPGRLAGISEGAHRISK